MPLSPYYVTSFWTWCWETTEGQCDACSHPSSVPYCWPHLRFRAVHLQRVLEFAVNCLWVHHVLSAPWQSKGSVWEETWSYTTGVPWPEAWKQQPQAVGMWVSSKLYAVWPQWHCEWEYVEFLGFLDVGTVHLELGQCESAITYLKQAEGVIAAIQEETECQTDLLSHSK